MNITVNDCLQLPIMSEATVVAGSGGLNKNVLGISVLETSKTILNSDSYKGFGGELVVTGFISCYDDIESMLRCVELFAKGGDSGLIIFYVGIYLKEIPKEVCELADKLDFPIIMMPKNTDAIPYSYVIYEVMQLIFQKKLEANAWRKNSHEIDAEFVQSILDEDRMSLHRLSFYIDDYPEDIRYMRYVYIEESFLKKGELLDKIRRFYKDNNIKAYIGIYKNSIVILISKKSSLISDEIDKLYEYIDDIYERPIISHLDKLNSLEDIISAYKLCAFTMKEIKFIFKTKKYFNRHELLFTEQCINLIKDGESDIQYYLSIVNKVEKSDKNLYETLESYLIDYNTNIIKTSENMFLHKNTVQYRLNKIKEAIGSNIFEFPAINQLTIAIAIKRIRNNR